MAPVDETPERSSHVDSVHHLDVRYLQLIRWTNVVFWGVVGLVALGTGFGLFWVLPTAWACLIPLIWLGLAGLAWLQIVVWPQWDFDAWSYRLDEHMVEFRHGVIWQVSVTIPMSRMQHVDLHQGPLESRWGLATLEIHTAGTRDASHKLPGLDVGTATDLRDQLVALQPRVK